MSILGGMKTELIRIDAEIAQQLRDLAFRKHGTTYGTIKEEAEIAIIKHIQGSDCNG